MQIVSTLNDFASKANTNEQVRRVTKSWSVDIWMECLDSGQKLLLRVSDGQINDVISNLDDTGEGQQESITLRSLTDDFIEIFEGRTNPALASLEGDLEVFGGEKHSVKLDAIALILWGFN